MSHSDMLGKSGTTREHENEKAGQPLEKVTKAASSFPVAVQTCENARCGGHACGKLDSEFDSCFDFITGQTTLLSALV